MKQQIRIGIWGFLSLLFSCSAWGQLISTREPLGVQAQILLHLDELERTWEVQAARKAQRRQGSAPGAQSEPPIPSDMQLSLQLKAIQGDMEFELYPRVRDFVQLFAHKKRSRTEAMLGLAHNYFPEIEHELAARRMPENLKFLPATLSALNHQAIAESGTVGLWQMPYHVAVRFGLVCTPELDERRDWKKSTQAALAYLQHLQRRYQDWTLAITAFTCGAGGVQSARNRAGEQANFEQLYPYLPEYSRDFVPAFMAVAYVMTYYQVLGLQALPLVSEVQEETVQLAEPLALGAVAEVLDLPEARLRALNPTWREGKAQADGRTMSLNLPVGYGRKFATQKAAIYAANARMLGTPAKVTPTPPTKVTPPVATTKAVKTPPKKAEKPPAKVAPPANTVALVYKIQRGDNLGAISRKFEVRLDQLKGWNGLENDNIRADDLLTVHVPKARAAKYLRTDGPALDEKHAPGKVKKAPRTQPAFKYYTVKKGDSLWKISQQYDGVSPEDIMEANDINEDIRPGMKLKIPAR